MADQMTDEKVMEYLNQLRFAARNTNVGADLTGFSEARNYVISMMDDRDALRQEVERLNAYEAAKPIGLEECPITRRPFFMNIEMDGVEVATYGGPFDSYTVPTRDDDDSMHAEQYDHDAGDWVDGGVHIGRFSEEDGYTMAQYNAIKAERDALAARLAEADAQAARVAEGAELAVLSDWLNVAFSPAGQQCCGRGSLHGCCGEPEPAYHEPHQVLEMMRIRHAELLSAKGPVQLTMHANDSVTEVTADEADVMRDAFDDVYDGVNHNTIEGLRAAGNALLALRCTTQEAQG